MLPSFAQGFIFKLTAWKRVGAWLSCNLQPTQVKEQIKKSIMSVMPQIASETFIDQKENRKVTFDLI